MSHIRIMIHTILLVMTAFSYGQNNVDLSLQKEARLSIRNGLNWLEKNQLEDGSWSNYPTIMHQSPYQLIQTEV